MESSKKNTPITSESDKGKIFVLHNKDTEKESQIDLIDLENDYLKLKENEGNPFPIDIFPKSIQEVAYECLNKYQFSLDYVGSGMLAAASASIGISYKVKVKNGWLEKANLFMVIVGNPGDSKSHSLNFCFKPIHIKENNLFHEYEKKLNEYENSKVENSEEKKIQRPILKKYLLNDYTPEALMINHYNNKRGLYVYVDELKGWVGRFDRYSNSSEAETYLSFWSGTTTSSDRATSKSLRLEDPFIGVIGSTQISVLKEFSKEGRNSNGFMDRLLFVYPNKQKSLKWNINTVDDVILQNYFAIITNLLELNEEFDKPSKIIPIEKSAKEYLFNWQNNRPEEKLFGYERGIEIKLQQYVIRFALILQLLHHIADKKTNDKVELFAIKGAIKLFNYYYYTAVMVRQDAVKKYYLETLTELQKTIYKELSIKEEFRTAEGIIIACKIINGKPRISERQFKNFLKDTKLFKRVKHGIYKNLL